MRKHSAVPLSVADPSRGSTALCLLSQADAVTGINRPNLLASSFSRRLQGDFRPSPLSALHQTAALFAGEKGVLVPFHAKLFRSPIHNIMFYPFVNGVFAHFCAISVPFPQVFPLRWKIFKNASFFLAQRYFLWYTLCCENGWIVPLEKKQGGISHGKPRQHHHLR